MGGSVAIMFHIQYLHHKKLSKDQELGLLPIGSRRDGDDGDDDGGDCDD